MFINIYVNLHVISDEYWNGNDLETTNRRMTTLFTRCREFSASSDNILIKINTHF